VAPTDRLPEWGATGASKKFRLFLQFLSSKPGDTSFNLSQRTNIADFLPIKSMECIMAKRKKGKGKKH
jgi:hypothetical protein